MPGMTSVPRKGRRDFEPTHCINETGMDCDKSVRRGLRSDGQQQSCRLVEWLSARFLAREGHY